MSAGARHRVLRPAQVLAAVLGGGLVPAATTAAAERWYTAEQVVRGHPLYQQHCAGCHKPDASGAPDWRKPGPEGRYPPPPLDGTAHTWHHPLPILRRTVKLGNIRLGGSMPAFGEELSDAQIDNVLAWIQAHWSDEVYEKWREISRRSSKDLIPSD